MKEKVLIIDDEQDFIDSLGERMRVRGMDVTAETSPSKALQLVEEKSFDAVVLDLQMPEMDGLETLKILKAKRPEIQVILLTAHATLEKGIEAMKLGAMDLLEKPTDLSVLAEKIHKAQAKKMIIVEKESEERIKDIMGSKGW
ncbi:response regulator [Desulfobacula phenolica]|uniref:Response regulator receiver domain-containing protein n=1 Tax=Desulfobacula phenolica TaxID=90732 RepID=A0A1H2DLJ0_9BACT|nr:response regulator [Desulfobacula phenolica]SDT83797.1 Response regulator receiver domain-containing protein [Desulfobacula phenolica]